MTAQDYFNDKGYVVLSNALNRKEADDLTKHMFSLHEKGLTKQDEQCPLSDAIYGDPVFDTLMMNLAKPLGEQIGKELIPTYTYARIYRPGDILKKHKDRESCEISATLTLGYDSKNIWPIGFEDAHGKEAMLALDVGDLAVYKGTELVHWREPFKGNWHVQVFVHYVDANGPYKEFAFDKRENIHQNNVQQNTDQQASQETNQPVNKINGIDIKPPVFESIFIPNNKDTFLPGYFAINSQNLPELMFTKEECKQIIDITTDAYPTNASVGSEKSSKVAKEIRSAKIYDITPTYENKWIFEKIAKAVSVANTVYFDYDISNIAHGLQLIHYPSDTDVKGHYNWHVDAGNDMLATRKISFTAQLSDPEDYVGCDLKVNNHCQEVQAVREQGSISLFPSYMPHIVTPIEKGDRYALVIWIHGSRRFK